MDAMRESSICALLLALLSFPASLQAEAVALRLMVRDSCLPGVPVLVRAELRGPDGRVARDVWDAEVALSTGTPGAILGETTVVLRNGRGSVLTEIEAPAGAEVSLEGVVASSSDGLAVGLVDQRTLRSLAGETQNVVGGEMPAAVTEWSGVVHVTADVRVPAGGTLRVLAGTLVIVEGVSSGEDGTSITVEGALESLGTESRPVTFTAANPARAWGEIEHDGADASTYRHTVITRTGHSDRGGHTNSGPALRPHGGSRIVFESCTISDNVGKVMQASGADLEFYDCLLSRSVMGPEIAGTALHFESSDLIGMFGELGNDGNDGDAIYIHDQSAGQEVLITGAVVADTTDDGVDTLSADVLVEDSILRDVACDKAMSVFGGSVDVRRCLFVDNDKGISAKSSDGSRVTVDHTTFVGNRWSIESRLKSNAQSPENRIQVTNSIIRHSGVPDGTEGCESNEPVGGRTIRTDFDPAYIVLEYSDLQDGFQVEGTFHGTWPGPGGNNMYTDPLFVSEPAHDLRLSTGSPCIDGGDPTYPADPDGTRTDMGALGPDSSQPQKTPFLRGDINGDTSLDLSDAVRLLLHLFAGVELHCDAAGDTDDDGAASGITDAIYLLEYLFLGGSPPPWPFPVCGVDPGDDGPGCESSPGC